MVGVSPGGYAGSAHCIADRKLPGHQSGEVKSGEVFEIGVTVGLRLKFLLLRLQGMIPHLPRDYLVRFLTV